MVGWTYAHIRLNLFDNIYTYIYSNIYILLIGVTDPNGVKRYVAAAFPSQCGKTNLAMLQSTLPGWKVECVGDDIAWMKFDENGILRAINPVMSFIKLGFSF